MNNQSNTSKNHYRLITSGGCIRFGRVEAQPVSADLTEPIQLELDINQSTIDNK